MADPDISARFLVRWLQEAGRRTAHRVPPAPAPAPAAAPPRSAPRVPHGRSLLLLALAALAFMPYFFADVHLRIYGLRHLIFFVFHELQ